MQCRSGIEDTLAMNGIVRNTWLIVVVFSLALLSSAQYEARKVLRPTRRWRSETQYRVSESGTLGLSLPTIQLP
jgi:hypothetical protein